MPLCAYTANRQQQYYRGVAEHSQTFITLLCQLPKLNVDVN